MSKFICMAFLIPRWYWKMRSGYIWKHFQMWANVPYWFAPCDTLKHLGRNNKCLVWVYNYERNWLISSYVNPCLSECKCCLNRSLQDDQGCLNTQLISKWIWSILSFTHSALHIRDLCVDLIKYVFLFNYLSLFVSPCFKKL